MSQWVRRENIQLAYPYLESRMTRAEWKRFVTQPKLNGVRCRALVTNSEVQLISSEGNLFPCVPHINDALNLDKLRGIELDGELYKHGWTWSKINSVASRTKNPHPEYEQLELHLFDVIDEHTSQVERLNLLYNCVKPEILAQCIQFVESTPCESIEEAYVLLVEYMKERYEGIVMRTWDGKYIRKRTNIMQKWKPRKMDCYPIVGWEEEHDQYGIPKGMIGALICETDGVKFKVSAGGLKHDQRLFYFNNPHELSDKYVIVKYVELTENNIPNHAVLTEIVDEYQEVDDDEYIY